MTKHPHDTLIRAWLDGKPVQYLDPADRWVDLAAPSAVTKTPHFYPDCSYRLKPRVARYRIGTLNGRILAADTLLDAAVLDRKGIVWLGDWVEVVL